MTEVPYVPSRNFGFQRQMRLQRIIKIKPAAGFEFEAKAWYTIELGCGCRSFTADGSVRLGAFMYCARHHEMEVA